MILSYSRRFFLCFSFIFQFVFSQKVLSQESLLQIKGLITDENKQIIVGANVVLRSKVDSSIIANIVTDTSGTFRFGKVKEGPYFLEITCVSYTKYYQNVNIINSDLDVGILKLMTDAKSLNEVVIKASKPLIEKKLDRFIVNVENRPIFIGSNAFDVIKTSPGIYIVGNENINIMGKEGVKVMLDGRLLQMSPDELIEMLKNMSADNIASIEIITTPSSKFDAQGNAGIINIITKRNKQKGWNINLGLTGYQGRNGRLIGNSSFNYKTENIDLITSYTIGKVNSFEDIYLYNKIYSPENNTINQFNSVNHERRKELYNALNGQLDIRLGKKINIGIAGKLFTDHSPRPAENNTSGNYGNVAIDSSFNTYNYHVLNLNNFSFDSYFNFKIDTAGKLMKISLGIANFGTEDNQAFNNSFYADGMVYGDEQKLRSFFKNNTLINSINIDFTLPYKKINLEMGAKFSHTKANNDFLFENFNVNQWDYNNNLSNGFDYIETNSSGYISLNKDLSKKISIQLGFRGEYTHTNGYSKTLDKSTELNYFQLFPTSYFQYRASNNYQLNISFSRRIGRPPYSYLNPFISYKSPLFSNEGNSLLKPSFTNSVEINNIVNSKYIYTVFYNYTNQYFTEFPVKLEGSNETRYIFDNIGSNQNVGLQTIIPITLKDWWSINNTGLVMMQGYKLSYGDIAQNLNQFFWLYILSNSFRINKSINVEFTGRYNSKSLQGFYRIANSADVGIGLTAKFWKEHATLAIGMTDILYTNRSIVNIKYPDQELGFTRYNDTRLLKLSLNYKFGNTQIKNKQRITSGSEEEQKRAGK